MNEQGESRSERARKLLTPMVHVVCHNVPPTMRGDADTSMMPEQTSVPIKRGHGRSAKAGKTETVLVTKNSKQGKTETVLVTKNSKQGKTETVLVTRILNKARPKQCW